VKDPSRSFPVAFTVALLAGLPSGAHAERVVLYPVGGRADETRIAEIQNRLSDAVRAIGHEPIAPPVGLETARPQTSAQMSGVAAASGATYVLLADVEPMPGQYRLHLRVGYQPTGRVEELVVTVLQAAEQARLRDVLGALLRPEGLGDDVVRLTGEPNPAQLEAERRRREEEERARRQAEEEERARRQAEEEERRRAEEAEERRREEEEARREREERARREQEAWEARPRYGEDGEWMLSVGVHGGYAAGFSSRTVMRSDGSTAQYGGGGGLFLIQARIGRFLSGTDGLEIRGGIDAVLGAIGAMNIVLGASWQWTPFVAPIHLGIVAECGAGFTFTGARDAGFLVRAGAIASWAPTPRLQIELALPEMGVMTNGPGAWIFGASARVGYRF
jgi:hypothetical protein